MTYNVGDPGHVKAHSDLVSSINTELARFDADSPWAPAAWSHPRMA